YLRDYPVGVQVHGVGRPRGRGLPVGDVVHADGLDPAFRTRSVDDDRLADPESRGAGHVEAVRADGDVRVGDAHLGALRVAGRAGRAVDLEPGGQHALDAHQAVGERVVRVVPLVGTDGPQHGGVALAAEDDAAGADLDVIDNVVFAGQ